MTTASLSMRGQGALRRATTLSPGRALAIWALGIKTSFAQLARAGWKPFVLELVASRDRLLRKQP
jgi:hypothetical protein